MRATAADATCRARTGCSASPPPATRDPASDTLNGRGRDPTMDRLLFEPGQKLGAFEILRRLRTGGMATLYLARRLGASGFERPVAIKVVLPHLARDPLFHRMFVDEALLSARIDHPNVVRVEELGEVGEA